MYGASMNFDARFTSCFETNEPLNIFEQENFAGKLFSG
jgi:hypothetical protein